MTILVTYPHTDRICAGLFLVVDAGVQVFLRQQPMIPLDLAVKPGPVATDALMP